VYAEYCTPGQGQVSRVEISPHPSCGACGAAHWSPHHTLRASPPPEGRGKEERVREGRDGGIEKSWHRRL